MKSTSWKDNLFDVAFGPLFRYLIRRSRRNARPVTWKPPVARLKKRLPWTMRNLRPQITEMRGRSDSHWRSFDLIFRTFRVHIILSGLDPDDIVFSSRRGGIELQMDGLQRTLDIRLKKASDLDLMIRSPTYEALDSFLCEYHEEIDKFYGFAR